MVGWPSLVSRWMEVRNAIRLPGGGRLGAFRAHASPNPVTGDDEWSKSGVVSEVASRVSLSKSEA